MAAGCGSGAVLLMLMVDQPRGVSEMTLVSQNPRYACTKLGNSNKSSNAKRTEKPLEPGAGMGGQNSLSDTLYTSTLLHLLGPKMERADARRQVIVCIIGNDKV